MKNFEKVQKGNPHHLTIKQHIFPVKSIQRFCDDQGYIQIYNFAANKKHKIKPDDQIFCARRSWDQRAETGYMKQIEGEFQEIAERVLMNQMDHDFDETDKLKLNEFYALWRLRSYYSTNPENDEPGNDKRSSGSG